MKWILFFAALVGVFWGVNWIYHSLDNAMLITNYWEAKESAKWLLINTEKESKFYAFESVNGYWGIFKGLWPVLILFGLIFLALIPASIYIVISLTNSQINNANQAQRKAEERAIEAIIQSNEQIREAQFNANEKVRNAEQSAYLKVKAELDTQTQKLQTKQNDLEEREAAISYREQTAKDIEIKSEQRVNKIIQEYNQEKTRFEKELREMETAKNHAQQGYKRIKKNLEREDIYG